MASLPAREVRALAACTRMNAPPAPAAGATPVDFAEAAYAWIGQQVGAHSYIGHKDVMANRVWRSSSIKGEPDRKRTQPDWGQADIGTSRFAVSMSKLLATSESEVEAAEAAKAAAEAQIKADAVGAAERLKMANHVEGGTGHPDQGDGLAAQFSELNSKFDSLSTLMQSLARQQTT